MSSECSDVLLPPLLLKIVPQPNNVLVVHHLHHLQLAVVVAAIQHHLLDRNDLAVLSTRAPYNTKSAIAHNLLQLVPVCTPVPNRSLLSAIHKVLDLCQITVHNNKDDLHSGGACL